MGQYYTALVIDKSNIIRKLDPTEFDSFYKLWEHAWIGNRFVNAVYSLIFKKPCKVAWIGDYSKGLYDEISEAKGGEVDMSKIPTEPNLCDILPGFKMKEPPRREISFSWTKALPYKQFLRMYDAAWGSKESMKSSDFTDDQLNLVNTYTKDMYLVNHDLKCYLDMEAYIYRSMKEEGECFNPLPLLTACGNGLGNGDYEGESCIEDIGTWAFHRIEYTDQIPEGYSEKEYCFFEERDTCTTTITM
ncbi:MAG: hypothetical protein FWH34_08890 [Desulfovibrionaceae bacterium]|nr:hypothetical protein [Desulfovibrionaceae bacterium]